MIAIIDYQAGNVASLENALRKVGTDCMVTADPQQVLASEGVVFPGQGRAGAAVSILRKTGLDKVIPLIARPFLGICLGLQLLGKYSEEDQTDCLDILPAASRRFPLPLKTPHLGWNRVTFVRVSELTAGIPDESYFYFAHSYYLDTFADYIVGKTAYGLDFPSIIQKNNYFAVQFHPEKSGVQGLRLLKNFGELCT